MEWRVKLLIQDFTRLHPLSIKSNLPEIPGDKEQEKASLPDIRGTETHAWNAWQRSVSESILWTLTSGEGICKNLRRCYLNSFFFGRQGNDS